MPPSDLTEESLGHRDLGLLRGSGTVKAGQPSPTALGVWGNSAIDEDAPLSNTVLDEVLEFKKQEEEQEKVLVQRGSEIAAGVEHRTSVVFTGAETDTKRLLVHVYITWWPFDVCIGLVIVANAITIGVETSHSVKGDPIPLAVEVCSALMLLIYTVELLLRYYAYGVKKAMISRWVRFDAFLVVGGFLDLAIKLIMNGESNEVLEKLMLVRMLRLARLARAARLMVQFKVLWQLVHGLMGSLLTVLWTFVLILALIYIFAILGMELMLPNPDLGEEYEAQAALFNDGLGSAMLTLVQFVTMDSIGSIYRPLTLANPILIVYFAAFLLIVSIALMNLVTAIIVDAAVQQSAADHEAQKAYESAKRKSVLPKLKLMFTELDADGSGELDLDEIKGAPEHVKSQLEEICNMEDCEALFKMLDYDQSGGIAIDEFCEGVIKASADKPVELMCMMRQCSEILKSNRDIASQLGSIEKRLSAIEARDRGGPSGVEVAADVH
mmetsp:Transcript_8460/g.17943  ORF Transcript_8460/g.17943 Transcript_8460/m.17943 type:complete len:496 (-) Transcript_8460:16-1503(-)